MAQPKRCTFAWQGWRTELPRGWNPVRLEGDYADGCAVIADLERQRMIMRWRGRKLEVNFDGASRRDIEVADQPSDRATLWAIFDLRFLVPANLRLCSHRLLAGDLSLTFADRDSMVAVRQIALAKLALVRQPLDAWLIDQQDRSSTAYRAAGPICDGEIETVAGTQIGCRVRRMRKRRRFILTRAPRELITIAAHDEPRDRLLIVEASGESLARQIARTIGAAQTEDQPDALVARGA